jgi:asparagine synthetase B (glutamine-hydrolysing)
MTEVVRHRGPDDAGMHLNGRVGLGACRLSIIDLAAGRQPIHDERGKNHVVFNGELYNYRSLRDTLESRGHTFYTNSDTFRWKSRKCRSRRPLRKRGRRPK